MLHLPLLAVLILRVSLATADEAGVVFAMGGEQYALTSACAQRVDYAVVEDDLVHIRFDMIDTAVCFEAFHGLLAPHLGERLAVTFRGEALLEAELRTLLGPENIVLVSRRPEIARQAAEFLRGKGP